MNIPTLPNLQPYLVILLPVLLPGFSSSLAALLGQEGFPKWLNDLIAWIALLAAATASVYAAGQLTGDPSGLIAVIVGTATLLVHGSLYKLRPYLTYLDFLQSLSVVKPTIKVVQTPQPAAKPPSPIVLAAGQQGMGTLTDTTLSSAVFGPPAPSQQPIYTPNLDVTATARQPSFVPNLSATGASSVASTSQWIPPSPDVHFGDSQVIPAIPKP